MISCQEYIGGLAGGDEYSLSLEGLGVGGIHFDDSEQMARNLEEELIIEGSVDETQHVCLAPLHF